MKSESDDITILHIRCPHCHKENPINLSENVKCEHCNKSLANEKYIKPIISGATALIIGLVGGTKIDNFFETNRYPVKVEYALIESCLSSYDKPLELKLYGYKKDICQEALTETQKKIDYKEYIKNSRVFLDEYEKQCKLAIYQKKEGGR